LREAPDTVAVATGYLGAHLAKSRGVKTYVSQYMFNTPATTSPAMDLAKMLAQRELIHSLADSDFRVVTQTRAGLMSFSPHPHLAPGQLAASTVLQLQLAPEIVHVVGWCEAHHAATVEDIVQSCGLVRGVFTRALHDMPDMALDPRVVARKEELVAEVGVLLEAVAALAPHAEDPLAEPTALLEALRRGYFDAPHLAGNQWAAARVVTAPVKGAIRALDPRTGETLPETKRLASLA
jgi:hypothetical protein